MVAISERVKEEKNPDKYVIDASALYPMLLRISSSEIIGQLSKLTILDLTKYEIGNIVRYDRSAKDQIKQIEQRPGFLGISAAGYCLRVIVRY